VAPPQHMPGTCCACGVQGISVEGWAQHTVRGCTAGSAITHMSAACLKLNTRQGCSASLQAERHCVHKHTRRRGGGLLTAGGAPRRGTISAGLCQGPATATARHPLMHSTLCSGTAEVVVGPHACAALWPYSIHVLRTASDRTCAGEVRHLALLPQELRVCVWGVAHTCQGVYTHRVT
jgi:hypothetical protein